MPRGTRGTGARQFIPGRNVPAGSDRSDFHELLAVLDLRPAGDDRFFGGHPSKNPIRTFGGQMMAQAFVAAGRTVNPKLPPNALSVHFIAGGDPAKDLEFTGCVTSAGSPTGGSTSPRTGNC
jgi:hypothetical protein